MDPITILGLVAGALTTSSFLPQVVKTSRSKSTKDISLGTFVILGLGTILWAIYGLYTRSLPVILTNIITLGLVSSIVLLKVRYK